MEQTISPFDDRLDAARALLREARYDAAAAIYRQCLADKAAVPSADERAEIQANFAITLCFMADRAAQATRAATMLEQARNLAEQALAHRTRANDPAIWAGGRLDLATIHIKLFERTADHGQLFAAHLALEGTEDALRDAGDNAGLSRIVALHDQLLALRR